jgi:hypothetical protein
VEIVIFIDRELIRKGNEAAMPLSKVTFDICLGGFLDYSLFHNSSTSYNMKVKENVSEM